MFNHETLNSSAGAARASAARRGYADRDGADQVRRALAG